MRAIWASLRVALVLGGLFALVDVWQVAILAPGSLSPATVVWLLGLYLAPAAAGGVAAGMVAAFLRWEPEAARRLGAGVVAGGGAVVLLAEVAMSRVHPLSPWRPWLGGAAVVGGVLSGALARRWRRTPAPALALWVVLYAAGGALAAWGGGWRTVPPAPVAGPSATGAPRPNLLVVLIDTLRADHLGCYGYDRDTSPAIDAFARDATQFLHAYSQSTWTKPATASVMTGRYPRQHQAYLQAAKLPESELLLPEALRAAGYRTGVFSGNPWVTREWGFDQGVDHFVSIYDERFARVTLFMRSLKRLEKMVDDRARLYNRVKLLVQGEFSTTARDPVVTKAFLDWAAEGGAPFYAHLHLMSPHHPYDPPPPYDRFVPDKAHAPVTYYPKKTYFFFEEGEAIDAAARADMIARYDGDIAFVDSVFGTLVETLRARGVLDQTAIVVLSDHGEEFYDHRNWGHGQSVYEELTHVPLLIRYPPSFPAGRRIETPVRTIDVMPTLLALAGAPPLESVAGRSLLPLVDGTAAVVAPAYSELLYRYGEARALVDGSAKVIHMRKADEARAERYDLASDPREQHPSPAADATGAPLLEKLEGITAWGDAHRSAAVEGTMDPAMQRRLKALGYVE